MTRLVINIKNGTRKHLNDRNGINIQKYKYCTFINKDETCEMYKHNYITGFDIPSSTLSIVFSLHDIYFQIHAWHA